MVSLLERKRFCEEYLTARDGQPFVITPERQWVLDEFWGPATGFKWWPVDPSRLCSSCAEKAGSIEHEWTFDNPTAGWHSAGCAGLELHPIVVTLLRLPRQEGKTLNTAGFNISTIGKEKDQSILYVAAAGAQTAKLQRDNYEIPIERNPKLNAAIRAVGATIRCEKNRSFIEFVDTSYSSITGTGRTIIVIDEARDVDARVMMAAFPSIFAQSGWRCPVGGPGHTKVSRGTALTHCTVCRSRLLPWWARVVVMSSAGLLEGTPEKEWFNDLCDDVTEEPHPNFHLFDKREHSNPNIDQRTKNALGDKFARIDAFKELVEVEFHNRPTRKGDKFLTKAEIDAVTDPRLKNQEGSAHRCVGFLDTSTTVELTSIVICEEVPQPPVEAYEPFKRIRVVRIQVWDPAEQAEHSIDEWTVLPWLDLYMPLFPGLRELNVDARLQPWAERLIKICNRGGQGRTWGKKVVAFRGREGERIAAWDAFEQRVKAQTVVLPDHPILRKELAAVKPVLRADGRREIRDASRKRRHADVADGLANCCYLAHVESMTSRLGLAGVEGRAGREQTRAALKRLWRPQVRGLREDSF